MLTPVIDTSKEYGLVLEGGGAKGAYQIGAWKALKEAGVKINAVAGTSVGALNGALICMDELEMAQQMWSNLTYSQVMDVDDTRMEQLMEGEAPFWEVVKDAFRHMSEGGVEVSRDGAGAAYKSSSLSKRGILPCICIRKVLGDEFAASEGTAAERRAGIYSVLAWDTVKTAGI